jgi:hypothetical protein
MSTLSQLSRAEASLIMMNIMENLKYVRQSSYIWIDVKKLECITTVNNIELQGSDSSWTMDYIVPVGCDYNLWKCLRLKAFPNSTYPIREHNDEF